MIHLSSADAPNYTECPSWKTFDHEENNLEDITITEEEREMEAMLTEQPE
jgi:hypothetical protein